MTPPFRIRQPRPFGRHEFWPGNYVHLGDAVRELERVGNMAADIVDTHGAVVFQSRIWWRRKVRMERP